MKKLVYAWIDRLDDRQLRIVYQFLLHFIR